jgi:hypothetical protein
VQSKIASLFATLACKEFKDERMFLHYTKVTGKTAIGQKLT